MQVLVAVGPRMSVQCIRKIEDRITSDQPVRLGLSTSLITSHKCCQPVLVHPHNTGIIPYTGVKAVAKLIGHKSDHPTKN